MASGHLLLVRTDKCKISIIMGESGIKKYRGVMACTIVSRQNTNTAIDPKTRITAHECVNLTIESLFLSNSLCSNDRPIYMYMEEAARIVENNYTIPILSYVGVERRKPQYLLYR